ncbi:hypothetical protein [Streptomyces sp. MK37H]|uniref:hypothetical protein n=1 Tax=Streptomyces sp. MK37H TaxID=2699117 RepID=UPI001B35F5FC|nr:hypothetical protein [Streptomyces sp. MK37H]MBP8531706.1 hypothetical protein [Streptomyces sp. MK37H]
MVSGALVRAAAMAGPHMSRAVNVPWHPARPPLDSPVVPAAGAEGTPGGRCPGYALPHAPGAARQRADFLDELTTAGTVASGHTDRADFAG